MKLFKKVLIMKTKVYLMIFVSICISSDIQAQVTVGSELIPNQGALLDIKTQEPSNINIDEQNLTATKGIGLSRVWLTNFNELYPMYNAGSLPADYANQKLLQKGLTVYNVNAAFQKGKGIYVWDTEKWIYTHGGDFTLTNETTTAGWPMLNITARNADMYLPNCYFVSPQPSAYTFTFPVKKAYAVWEYYEAPGATYPFPKTGVPTGICTAELLWQDKQSLVQSVSISSSVKDPNAIITVNFSGASAEGNAVIVFKVNGTIYWSWHLWVTAYNPDIITVTPDIYDEFTSPAANGSVYQYNNYMKGGDYIFLDRNVGAIGSTPADHPGVQGLVYQWGRKDPFPPYGGNFYDINDTKMGEATNNPASVGTLNTLNVTTYGAANNLANSINNPFTFYYKPTSPSGYYGSWYTNLPTSNYKTLRGDLNFELWNENGHKTPFDPCPEGWKVPPKTNYRSPFWSQPAIMNITGSYSYRPSNYGLDPDTDYDRGWKFYYADYKLGYFPEVRQRDATGSAGNAGAVGIWDSTLDPDFGNNGAWEYNYYTKDQIRLRDTFWHQNASHPVRCMKE